MAPPKRGLRLDLSGSSPNLTAMTGGSMDAQMVENTGTVHNVGSGAGNGNGGGGGSLVANIPAGGGAAGMGLVNSMEGEVTGTMMRVGDGENSMADFQERIRNIGNSTGANVMAVEPEDLEQLEELGSGNGGTVFLVRHRKLGKIMARKVGGI